MDFNKMDTTQLKNLIADANRELSERTSIVDPLLDTLKEKTSRLVDLLSGSVILEGEVEVFYYIDDPSSPSVCVDYCDALESNFEKKLKVATKETIKEVKALDKECRKLTKILAEKYSVTEDTIGDLVDWYE